MKVLVTGGAGFIGSNTVEKLLNRDYSVVILDDLFLGSKDNIKDLKEKGDLKFIEGDVRNRETVKKAIKGCEGVIHEAARSSAPMHKENPQEGAEVNILGFINVLEEARKQDVDNIVYASTSSMYGSIKPPHKEDSGEHPTNLYSASKMSRELYGKVYADVYGLNTVGLRYFSVYGPREKSKGRFANIISQFLWKMLDNQSPVIYGDGSQTRDFTFVKDIARANISALESSGLKGIYMNVGTENETSFNKAVDMLNEKLGKDIEPEYQENPIENYVSRTKADISKAKKLIGYEPKVSIKEGIKRIVNYYS